MKYLVLLTLLFANVGCIIVLKKEDSALGQSSEALNEAKMQVWAEGIPLNDFVATWGEPESLIADKKTAVLFYDTNKGPYKFVFINRKLNSWRPHYGKTDEVMRQYDFHSNIVGN